MNRNGNVHPMRRTRGLTIGGILGVLALIAVVIIGYMLITDDSAATEVQEQAQEQTTELQEGFDAAEARAQLNGLRSAIESEIDEEALRQQYDDVRAELETAYADASGEAAEAWTEISSGLETLGDQIGQESEEAVATIDDMLAQFPRNE